MRNLWALGFISAVTVAAFAACGDDSGNGNGGTAGTGGSAGAGGGAGAAGTAGSAGTAGAGGSTGTAGTGNTPPPPPATNCTGCLQLTVPLPTTVLDTMNNRSSVQAAFTTGATAAPYDLTNVTQITWKIQVLTPDANFFISPFVQDGPPEDPNYAYSVSSPAVVPLTAAAFPSGTFQNVTLDLPGGTATVTDAGADGGADSGAVDAGAVVDAGAADGGVQLLTAFDKSKVRIVGINVGGLAAAAGQQVSIEIDSVTLTGTSNFPAHTFDTTVEGLTLNTYYNFPPGSTLTAH